MTGRREARLRLRPNRLAEETTHTYTPSDARAARALCCDDASAERAPRVRVVKETLWGVPGMHVAHFRPMCLTARNSLRHPKSHVMSRETISRTFIYGPPGEIKLDTSFRHRAERDTSQKCWRRGRCVWDSTPAHKRSCAKRSCMVTIRTLTCPLQRWMEFQRGCPCSFASSRSSTSTLRLACFR